MDSVIIIFFTVVRAKKKRERKRHENVTTMKGNEKIYLAIYLASCISKMIERKDGTHRKRKGKKKREK